MATTPQARIRCFVKYLVKYFGLKVLRSIFAGMLASLTRLAQRCELKTLSISYSCGLPALYCLVLRDWTLQCCAIGTSNGLGGRSEERPSPIKAWVKSEGGWPKGDEGTRGPSSCHSQLKAPSFITDQSADHLKINTDSTFEI